MPKFDILEEQNPKAERRKPQLCPISVVAIVIVMLLLILFVIGCVIYFTSMSAKLIISQTKIGGILWPFTDEKYEKQWNFEEKNLNRGDHTFPVPLRLFSTNRQRLCKEVRSRDVPKKSFILLEGGKESALRYHTHLEISPFRQESYFVWAFGVEEAGFVGAIQVNTCRSILFVPHLGTSKLSYWTGRSFTKEDLLDKYGVDDADETKNLEKTLNETETTTLLLLDSIHAFSFRWMRQSNESKIFANLTDKFAVDNHTLGEVMTELRLIKSPLEQEVLRYVANVSSTAHKFLMKSVRPNMFEYHLESLFNHYAYFRRGCRLSAYTGIVGSGPNAAILHYGSAEGPNNRKMRDGDLCLIDMGAEYFCYGSDLTRTIPVGGKYTKQQKFIYDAVLNASKVAQAAAKPDFRECYGESGASSWS